MTSLGDMSTDRVIRNISHKLRHYLEVERREEGFITAPKKRKDPKSTKSFSSLVHDRSMHHLFDSQQAHRILAYLEENSRLSTREKQVRSELVQHMTNGEISAPKIVNSGIPKFDKTADVCRDKKRHEFLGSVPKAEAERLVTIATKLYVTTEMLLSNEYCQSNDVNYEEEESTRDDTTEEKATPIGEFIIPDLRSEKQSPAEEPIICEAAVNTDVEQIPGDNLSTAANDNLPTTKILKDASCQTENREELCEGDKDPVAESDIESGVHVFSNNSSAARTRSGNRKLVESSSSQSSDLSEDSNYCDETYSDEEDSSLCESSELADEATGVGRVATEERPEPSNSERSLSTKESKAKEAVPSILTENVSNPSDVESNSSETCSTCNSYTCSCNSCNEESNVFVIQQSKEECSECSTCSCSCSSDKSANNESETGYEERGVTSEFNNEADINNNTVATVPDQNAVRDAESSADRSANEERKEENSVDEVTSKHPMISHQLTIESWDSQEMDEEAQILSIHEAARNGDLPVVELLSKANRKYIETVDERGWTPIHLAAANGHTEIVKFLALEGAHISALDPSGYTALHISAMRGHKDCMEALLEAEADIESVTSDGFTALHLAALNNHIRCCKVLLAWGASLKKEDALGRTVVDMAEEYSLKRVKRLIQNFHKQLDNINTIVDTMEAFSDKKRPKSEKPLPRNLLDIMTSVMTDEQSSD